VDSSGSEIKNVRTVAESPDKVEDGVLGTRTPQDNRDGVMMSELEGEKEREETRREDQDDVFWTPKNVKVE
jgi:hypothetical protein